MCDIEIKIYGPSFTLSLNLLFFSLTFPGPTEFKCISFYIKPNWKEYMFKKSSTAFSLLSFQLTFFNVDYLVIVCIWLLQWSEIAYNAETNSEV